MLKILFHSLSVLSLLLTSTAGFSQSEETLQTDFVLTGTIIQSQRKLSMAQITTKDGSQQIFAEGEEIAEGITLEKIEDERIWISSNRQQYIIEINSSQASAPVSYSSEGMATTSSNNTVTNNSTPIANNISSADYTSGNVAAKASKLTQHQIDHPEFYTEKGVLMEGAHGLKTDDTKGSNSDQLESNNELASKIQQDNQSNFSSTSSITDAGKGSSNKGQSGRTGEVAKGIGDSNLSNTASQDNNGAVSNKFANVKNPTQHQIDHPEFYNEKGVLMEGAPELNSSVSTLEPVNDVLE